MATQRTGGTPEEKERAHWHADFGGTRGFPFSFPKHIQLAATAASADPSFGFTVAPYLCATALFHTSLVNVTRLGNVGIREASIIASHVVAETERASPAPCVARPQKSSGGGKQHPAAHAAHARKPNVGPTRSRLHGSWPPTLGCFSQAAPAARPRPR